MTLRIGNYGLGPQAGRLLLKTGRTGLGRRAGHDLTIEATRWQADVAVNSEDPDQSSVSVTIEVESVEVREGAGGLKPLTDADRADIKTTICEKILLTTEHPVITFNSSHVTGTPDAFQISGDLMIMGLARPVIVHGGVDAGRLRGHATVTQSRWGIKPYSAFAGALRLADDIQVEFDLASPGEAAPLAG
jgi:polyisoprenoid-binding protein YceI